MKIKITQSSALNTSFLDPNPEALGYFGKRKIIKYLLLVLLFFVSSGAIHAQYVESLTLTTTDGAVYDTSSRSYYTYTALGLEDSVWSQGYNFINFPNPWSFTSARKIHYNAQNKKSVTTNYNENNEPSSQTVYKYENGLSKVDTVYRYEMGQKVVMGYYLYTYNAAKDTVTMTMWVDDAAPQVNFVLSSKIETFYQDNKRISDKIYSYSQSNGFVLISQIRHGYNDQGSPSDDTTENILTQKLTLMRHLYDPSGSLIEKRFYEKDLSIPQPTPFLIKYKIKYFYPSVGIANKTAKQLVNIYPNPSSDKVYLPQLSNRKATTVSVLDINGHVIQSSSLKELYSGLDISELVNGMYLLRLDDGSVGRFIKTTE